MNLLFNATLLFIIMLKVETKGYAQRMMYSTTRNADDCDVCINFGQEHCWGRDPTTDTGLEDWDTSYCCSPTDSICDSLSYCSSAVSNSNLKLFTCPIDTRKCPSSSQANV